MGGTLFKQGESLLASMFAQASQPISYGRAGVTIARDIPAKLGRTLFRTDDLAGGVSFRFEQRDFIIRVADVPALDEPKRGDVILHDGKTYIVSAPDGEPCWRWHTRQTHTQIRIHAKCTGGVE